MKKYVFTLFIILTLVVSVYASSDYIKNFVVNYTCGSKMGKYKASIMMSKPQSSPLKVYVLEYSAYDVMVDVCFSNNDRRLKTCNDKRRAIIPLSSIKIIVKGWDYFDLGNSFHNGY